MKHIKTVSFVLLVHFSIIAQPSHESLKKDLVFKNNDITISGTLYHKEANKKGIAVVFVHGSSPTTRSDRYYNYLNEYFLAKDISTFLYDKRGSGESGNVIVDPVDFNDLANDLVEAVAAVKAEVGEGIKIGVVGTSQGGWVGPLAASISNDISFVVTISGPATNTLEQNLFQKGEKLKHYGISQDGIQETLIYLEKLYEYFEAPNDFQNLTDLNNASANKEWFSYLESYEKTIYPPSVIDSHPGFQRFKKKFNYDPEPTLKEISVPFLAVFGEKDRITPVEKSIERIKEYTTEAGNSRFFEIKSFPNSGHFIQLVETPVELLVTIPETTEQEKISYFTNFKPNPDFVNYLLAWVQQLK